MDRVRELLQEAVTTPGHDIDVDATLRAAQKRRRRRMLVAAGGVASLVVASSVAGFTVFGAGGNGSRVQIGLASTATNHDAGVSLELPTGWQELATVQRSAPTEVLVVGTAARPTGDPIEACTPVGGGGVPGARAAYVSVYEYQPGDPLTDPTGGPTFPFAAFQPRPATFAAAQMLKGDCGPAPAPTPPSSETSTTTSTAPSSPAKSSSDATSTSSPETTSVPTTTVPDASSPTSAPLTQPPALADHFRQVTFTDAKRLFLARIISVDDPSQTLLKQGLAVLDTLALHAANLDTTTTTSSAVGPPDEQAARQQIHDAMTAAYGGASPIPLEESVEGGHPFSRPQDRQTAATAPGAQPALQGRIVVRINSLRFDSTTHATLNFDLLVDGNPITATTTGYAVLEGGHWRMGRATYCEIVARGGVLTCPR